MNYALITGKNKNDYSGLVKVDHNGPYKNKIIDPVTGEIVSQDRIVKTFTSNEDFSTVEKKMLKNEKTYSSNPEKDGANLTANGQLFKLFRSMFKGMFFYDMWLEQGNPEDFYYGKQIKVLTKSNEVKGWLGEENKQLIAIDKKTNKKKLFGQISKNNILKALKWIYSINSELNEEVNYFDY